MNILKWMKSRMTLSAKRLTVVAEKKKSTPYMITKGALDNVLTACSRVQIGDEEIALDTGQLAKIQERYEAWSAQGYRVLGVAVKSAGGQAHPFSKTSETDMTFAGFLLFFDPPTKGRGDRHHSGAGEIRR